MKNKALLRNAIILTFIMLGLIFLFAVGFWALFAWENFLETIAPAILNRPF